MLLLHFVPKALFSQAMASYMLSFSTICQVQNFRPHSTPMFVVRNVAQMMLLYLRAQEKIFLKPLLHISLSKDLAHTRKGPTLKGS